MLSALCLHVAQVLLHLLVGGLLSVSDGQLACISEQPCSCSGWDVYCEGKNLTTIPRMDRYTYNYTYLDVHLNYNKLVRIPKHAFRVLFNKSVHIDMDIDLSVNRLETIDTGAFKLVEDHLQSLFLNNNSLTCLPKELLNLKSLMVLHVYSNPIVTLDPAIMTSLGHHLDEIAFGSSSLAKWPKAEVASLSQLTKLKLFFLPFEDLPDDAFAPALGETVTQLEISFSNVTSIPEAICRLRNLDRLEMDFNPKVKESTIPDCDPPLEKVTSISCQDTTFPTFPAFMVAFTNLKYLSVTYNEAITSIPDEAFSPTSQVTNLGIYHNKINVIPTGLKEMKHLDSLTLNGNAITSIDEHDFVNVTSVTRILLDENPLQSISDMAFQNLPTVTLLSLRQTNLTTIPKGVRNLENLTWIGLDGSPLVCNCSMKWMLSWPQVTSHRLAIYGQCSRTETLSDFIFKVLPKCP